MADVVSEARSKLQAALTEIEREIDRLDRALSHLRAPNHSTPRKPPRKPTEARSARLRGKRKARVPKGQRRDEVLKAIIAEPGTTAAKVAEKLGISPSQVSTIARKLAKDRLVVKTGASYTAKPSKKAKAVKAPAAA